VRCGAEWISDVQGCRLSSSQYFLFQLVSTTTSIIRAAIYSLPLPCLPPCLCASVRGPWHRGRRGGLGMWNVRCGAEWISDVQGCRLSSSQYFLFQLVSTTTSIIRAAIYSLPLPCLPPCLCASVRASLPSSSGAASKPAIGSKQRPFGQRTST
jgi:hypothetical protein